MPPRRDVLLAILSGIVAAAVALAFAEVVAVFTGAAGSPLIAVGSFVIDIAPPGVKDAVIALFGTGDKVVLLLSIAVAIAVLAVGAGLLEYRRPPFGVVLLAVVAGLGALASVSREGASWVDAAPSVVGMVAGAGVLRSASVRLRGWQQDDEVAATGRRSFLRFVGVAGVAAVVIGTGARILTSASAAVTAVRQAVALPVPASSASALPAGAVLDHIEGISSFVTPNARFYRIDTALSVPSVEPADWSLRITGMVEEEIEITWNELLALPLEEHLVTLSCVSNEVGGDLIGTALWLGYPLRELLARARPTAGADMVLSRSVDGFTASTPLDVLQDTNRASLLAVGMNGEPLPVEHGFPVRMVVPGLYGYVSATKWVVELKVTTFAADLAYWSTRGWTERGPIKIESRIDVPRQGQPIEAGTIAIAGVAWAPHTGIAKVEVQIDDGVWQEARLAEAVTADTWIQWVQEWDATPGTHVVTVRATGTDGTVQTTVERPPAPNGATGLHQRSVSVAVPAPTR
ncbi:molybdopterin-dependent oxidoreductase [Rathayibacter iranicus]|uniref:Oxidoreductase n=2 Tax=Rathayibacter iranicus TaxID=59737 RepID=A0AAD2JFV2_9MICO|nr:molybdopterin-dependent oxidoreductase [Rathayibacter iranicus]AZZ54513.1 oxidoreductase [Rathayibacter iranicus]MWV29942.1 molybdopterin-dependent oxidoreductase [Rathayibacter iranicus NCPPB 2253 = VKM Ac-1602]PPI51687.1 oxidoreductase [Rathayibacter iranicus]PPI63856.1 oxidoreductase [Rathayibacter iranicus]PPI74701.1 oxidoreductase [Rathayibacter iranicus]